jgi:mRNA-degrading endonuclease RelE of RelBE toxin-antitoxin system
VNFVWPKSARAELRAIDREVALRMLEALTAYGVSGRGDIKALAGQWQGCFRLRVSDYRVLFTIAPDEITILRVANRSEAYR